MHLAYLDDSDTKAKALKWQVMSGVIIEDNMFKLVEVGVSVVPEILIPIEKMPDFEEFHACELYGGFGIFSGINQKVRFDAIRQLLSIIGVAELKIVYGAVDLAKLKNEIYASADPLDISFRICIDGIKSWAEQDASDRVLATLGDEITNYSLERITPHIVDGVLSTLVILIADDCDNKIRARLQRSYRGLRPSRKLVNDSAFSCFHDDMYFGDSRYSIGIQLADLCSYFIARHLDQDAETESFYEMIEPHIVYSQIHPPIPTQKAITDGK